MSDNGHKFQLISDFKMHHFCLQVRVGEHVCLVIQNRTIISTCGDGITVLPGGVLISSG